jgi:hypothetical protein
MAAASSNRYARPLALALGLALALAASAWAARPDGLLHVVFPATPGDAVLIQTPDGAYALVDGGGDGARLALELGRVLPFHRRTLDMVLLTRADHGRALGQVAALTRYRAALALGPPQASRSAARRQIQALLHGQGAQVTVARVGQRLRLGALTTLEVLDVPSDGEGGMLLRVEYGATSVLLAGALSPGQAARLPELEAVSAAQLPWEQALERGLLARLRSRAIIYADAYSAKHPPQQSYRERAWGGWALYHEKNDGRIELVSDGQRMWVTTEQ